MQEKNGYQDTYRRENFYIVTVPPRNGGFLRTTWKRQKGTGIWTKVTRIVRVEVKDASRSEVSG